jgi:hypothetical protein
MEAALIEDSNAQPVEFVADIPGTRPLRRPAHERYARARALLLPKVDAYLQAFGLDRSGMTPGQLHCARGNASRLEGGRGCPGMSDRIAYLTRGDEKVLAEKRKRLEEFLWLVHEHDPRELWETAERPLLNKLGQPIKGPDGHPIMIKYQRAKAMEDLPDDVARIVQVVKITDSGEIVTETYSKMQANVELRKLLGIGNVPAAMGGDDLSTVSTAEIVAELQGLGVDIRIGVGVARGLLR